MPSSAKPRVVRQTQAGAETRARIIDASIAILAERGYAGFTLQAVAERAGVLFGSLTYHFKSRDALVTAMIDGLVERYRIQFRALVETAGNNAVDPVADVVGWLLDDAVDPGTANIFLELWAISTHHPDIALRVNALYDEAVEAFIEVFGANPKKAEVQPLREGLYLLGSVIEGSSAIFSSRQNGEALWAGHRQNALAMLVPFLQLRVQEAASSAPAHALEQEPTKSQD